MIQENFSLSLRIVKALAKRDLRSTLRGWGFYIVMFFSLIISPFILKDYLNSIRENGILVSPDILNYPLFISVVIVSFYLAALSAISISREKEQGTLETLFYGPVSSLSYILGKYIKDILIYLVMVAFFFAYFWGVSLVTGLSFSYGLVKSILFSIFSVSCVISFSLFISTLTKRVRSSIILLIGIFILLAIQAGQGIFFILPPEEMSSALTHLGDTLSAISGGINWISPFSYLARDINAVSLGNPFSYALNILYSIIYSAVLLILTFFVFTFKKKGARG